MTNRRFRPVVTSLEGRSLLSVSIKGTLPGLMAENWGLTPATNPNGVVAVFGGKLSKIEVSGSVWLDWGPPQPQYDFITIWQSRRSGAVMEPIAAPVPSGSEAGPLTVTLRVTTAKGKFASDLNAIVSATIVKVKQTVKHGVASNLLVWFSPEPSSSGDVSPVPVQAAALARDAALVLTRS
jgi:hypothetical protein